MSDKLVLGGKVGPTVSSACTYLLTNKPEDVWAAKMNDWFKTNLDGWVLRIYVF